MAVLRRGMVPRETDDRWFAFMEQDRLFISRSWTGLAVYQVQFTRSGDGFFVTELLVCGDAEEYRRFPDAHESAQLERTIRLVLLDQGRQVFFGSDADEPSSGQA